MVVVRIMGGLGNQLFQYAAGRRLAMANNDQLMLDVSSYAVGPRPYRLNKFRISERIASESDIERLTGAVIGTHFKLPAGVRGRLNRYARRLGLGGNRVIAERDSGFHPELLGAKGDVYLDGYWQSEMYFKDIADLIRREFTTGRQWDSVNRGAANAIASCESVSLHIRRGDYLSNPLYNQVHGVCPLDFYDSAVRLIADAVKNPCFFVFSDDLEWAKENLRLDYPTAYMDHNGEDRDYEDLRLMSLCKHHIIANSSFSWWGAWLCVNPRKMVIAPKKWFNDQTKDSTAVVPPSWWRV